MAKRRSSKRTKELTDTILERIAAGESLRAVCRNNEIPVAPSTFVLWCNEDPVLAEQYARAMEARADAMFDEMMEIADTPVEGKRVEQSEETYKEIREDMLGHRRLQVDVRKWALARMAPKKYGDKIDHSVSGQIAVINRDDEQL